MFYILMALLTLAWLGVFGISIYWVFDSLMNLSVERGYDTDSDKRHILRALIGFLGVVFCLAFLIMAIDKSGAHDSEHCAPGTTYRESSHYDPATKTVRRDWVCEPSQ